MLKSKRLLLLTVIPLLSSLICPIECAYLTSSNATSSNTETSQYKYNHATNNSHINSSDGNVMEHKNPKAMKVLRRNSTPSNSLNEKTAYQYAVMNDKFDKTATTSSPFSMITHNLSVDVTTSAAKLASATTPSPESPIIVHHEPHVKFAVLLPEKQRRRDIRILSTVRPVIEMATNVVTGPQGVLRNVRIEIDYRDTQCSSTYGALGAFDIFLKRKPGTNVVYTVLLLVVLRHAGSIFKKSINIAFNAGKKSNRMKFITLYNFLSRDHKPRQRSSIQQFTAVVLKVRMSTHIELNN